MAGRDRRAAPIGSNIGKLDLSSGPADEDVLVYDTATAKWVSTQVSTMASFVEAAQDAVGTILADSAELNFTYTDATPAITATLIDASIAYARIANASSLSVLGRAANSSGVLADIQAGTDNQVLRRSGTAIAFGALNLASSDAVTGDLPFANLAQITGPAVLGVSSAATADNAAISASTNDRLLRRTSDALNFGQLTAGMFPSAVVPDAALSSNVPLKNAANTFTAVQAVNATGISVSAGDLTSYPAAALASDVRYLVAAEAASVSTLMLQVGGTTGAGFRCAGANGTYATPAAVSTSIAYLGYFAASGYDGTNWQTTTAGLIGIRPTATWSGTQRPTAVVVETTNDSSTARTERVRVKPGGQMRFVPLSAAPTTYVEDGDVYYNSGTAKLQVRASGAWVDLH